MRLILLFILVISCFSSREATAQITAPTARAVLEATLVIRSADGRDSFLGSGFVVGVGDQVVTNAHVVGHADRVTVVTRDGQRFFATVDQRDKARDLALLHLSTPLPFALQLADAAPDVGATVYAAGAPLEAGFSLTVGIVSRTGRQIEETQPVAYLQHSAPVNPGSSGGPLVDPNGAVVGVNAQISDGSRFFVGIAYAVPMVEVRDFLATGPLPVHPAPGLLLRDMAPRIAAALGFEGQGVLVEEAMAGRPAAQAGLVAGDILINAAGLPIHKPGDLAFALADAGVEVPVTVWRQGDTLHLTIERRPQTAALQSSSSQTVQRKTNYRLTDMGLVLDPDGLIRAVVSQGAGYFAGLTGGDRIEAINGQNVTGMATTWSKDFTFDTPIVLRIRLASGATRHYVLDPWAPHDGLRLPSGANMLGEEVVNFD